MCSSEIERSPGGLVIIQIGRSLGLLRRRPSGRARRVRTTGVQPGAACRAVPLLLGDLHHVHSGLLGVDVAGFWSRPAVMRASSTIATILQPH